MLDVAVREFSAEAWCDAASGFGAGSLVQSWEYAEAKARTGPWAVERGVLVDGTAPPVGLYQALVRRLPAGLPGGLAWINRGPLWRRAGSDGAPLVAMLEALRRHYAEERRLYLRLAPPADEAALPPAFVAAAGFRPAAPGWASARLDLTAPVEALRGNLGAKWRGHLNKGERAGLEVRSGTAADLFEAFLDHHRRLLAERRFATSLTPDLLRCLHALQPEGRHLAVWLAEAGGSVLASVLMARYGDSCEYLAGNTGAEGRRLNAGQVLLWRALVAMKEHGCASLDLGGMDPEATPPGILAFKQGLGGRPYRLAPELEAGGGGIMGRIVRWRAARARAAA